ncbi:MAG: glycerol-3-phosphate acyltransferase, partial [Verrucomicrobia bacterium]|nr:glycerol-3-phosphate acyltransferase [Verrucomicrobiota bacterium]
GKGPGTLVLLVDAAKGTLACAGLPTLAKAFGGLPPDATPATQEWMAILAGVGVVLGHNYTCLLWFKGGKGIATSAGVLGALAPVPLAWVVGVFIVTLAITRYVSLGSILAAAALPVAVALTGGSGRLLGVCGVLSALAICKHRANIGRLLAGTESRVGAKRAEGAP